MIPRDWLTPTRASGLAAYGIALASSAFAWLRTRRSHTPSTLAASVTVTETLLLIDMTIDARWRLHQLLEDAAQSRHEYGARTLPQTMVLSVLTAMFFISLIFALRVYRNRKGALLAIAGALLSLLAWCVEIVSLHAVDSILYHSLGSVMVISLVWILACSMTAIGILIDARHPSHQANC